VDDALDAARFSSMKRSIRMDKQLAPDIPVYIVGDDGRTRQVLLSLLLFGCHCAADTVRLTVRAVPTRIQYR
jgi:hypothetical protein